MVYAVQQGQGHCKLCLQESYVAVMQARTMSPESMLTHLQSTKQGSITAHDALSIQ